MWFSRNRPASRTNRSRRLKLEQFEDRRLLTAIIVDTLVDEADGRIDDGDVSLRDALATAQQGDVVQFATALDGGTIRLTDDALRIATPLTVDASMLTDGLTIDGRSGAFFVEYRDSDGGFQTEIRGLTLTGAVTAGAVYSKEPLAIHNCRITGNASHGVHATYALSVTDSEITNNGGHGTFGNRSTEADVDIRNSVITGNGQDGVFGYIATVVDSIVTGNVGRGVVGRRYGAVSQSTIAENGGHGVSGSYGASATDSVVTDNTGSGVYSSYGTASARSSTISRNGGHGVHGWFGAAATDSRLADNGTNGIIADRENGGASVVRSTIVNNGGTGVLTPGFDSSIRLADSTLSGNLMGGVRGGLDTLVRNSTISGNSMFGVSTLYGEILNSTIVDNDQGLSIGGRGDSSNQVSNSIIARNTAGDISFAEDAEPESWLSHNLIGDNTGSGLAEAPVGSPDQGGNLIGDPNGVGLIDPLLSVLGSFGGSIQTHVPLPNSPVIDAGEIAGSPEFELPEFDQRGFSRIVNGRLDIGSTESQSALIDFDGDGQLSCTDIDELALSILTADNNRRFDLNSDSSVDHVDLDAWLTLAGIASSPNSMPYVRGDVNLDGQVDALDLNEIAKNWQSPTTGYCSGDIVVDGVVDPLDLNQIGLHWPQSTIAARRMPKAAIATAPNRIRQIDHALAFVERDLRAASLSKSIATGTLGTSAQDHKRARLLPEESNPIFCPTKVQGQVAGGTEANFAATGLRFRR